ncbi:hypothetical protein [Desulfamplus magnetovallimortis]|nr:hypothetical protein [Desulfamplus magnetovallimortis]
MLRIDNPALSFLILGILIQTVVTMLTRSWMSALSIILPYPVNFGHPDSDTIDKGQEVICADFEQIIFKP